MIIIKNCANRKIIVDNCVWRNCVLYKLRIVYFSCVFTNHNVCGLYWLSIHRRGNR